MTMASSLLFVQPVTEDLQMNAKRLFAIGLMFSLILVAYAPTRANGEVLDEGGCPAVNNSLKIGDLDTSGLTLDELILWIEGKRMPIHVDVFGLPCPTYVTTAWWHRYWNTYSSRRRWLRQNGFQGPVSGISRHHHRRR
jgi:hypothetical protein